MKNKYTKLLFVEDNIELETVQILNDMGVYVIIYPKGNNCPVCVELQIDKGSVGAIGFEVNGEEEEDDTI